MAPPVTLLDKTLIDVARGAKPQIVFYNAFLTSKLFVPLPIDQLLHHATRRTEKNEQINLIVIKHNGKNYVPAFDLLERLTAWIKRKTNYIALPAHVLMQMIPADLHLMLNTGTEFAKEFVPDEITMLRNTIEKAQPKPTIFPVGTQVYVRAPEQIPAGLELALCNCLQSNFEISYAYIGEVHFCIPGEKPHLYITLEAEGPIENILEPLRQDIGIALRPFYNESNPIGIAFLGVDAIAADIKRATKPFYQRTVTRH